MYGKLALRNIRRSVRDYGIYFITLVFGVAMFYAFNSVSSQQVLFDLEGSAGENVFNLTGTFLAMFSVVIACVLGFLVIYANRFLIRRRKREFGIYLTLGMSPGRVSQIVLMETVLVGLVSLACGAVLGLALSQGLSFVTAGLFDIPMQQYHFIFSEHAFNLTLLCFVVIYVIVALFNTVSVSRYKLIDLLSARAKNERFHARNPWVSLGVFVVSLGIIAAAYWQLVENGLMDFDGQFWLATALMLAGTLLFFWSLSGFVIAAVQRTRGVYLRGLTMFTVRQIASKVNTAFLSLWVVCVMLFFSVTVFSSGMGLVQAFSGNVSESTLYDATLTANIFLQDMGTVDHTSNVNAEDESQAAESEYLEERRADSAKLREEAGAWDWSIEAFLAASNPAWNDFVEEAVQVDVYQPAENTTTYSELMERFGEGTGNKEQDESVGKQTMVVVGVSQFNALRQLCGRETVEVEDGRFMVNNTVDTTEALSRAVAARGTEVVVGGLALSAAGDMASQPLSTTTFVSDALELVVPDAVIDELRAADMVPCYSCLNVNYSVGRAQGDALLTQALATAVPPTEAWAELGWGFSTQPWPVTLVLTANEALAQANNMRMMITYLALYIGFVFLIATAAILAIQQLSETSDSLPRYRVLAQIGCDRSMILRSLRTQVILYFVAPLGLAICHSVCAVGVLGKTLFDQIGVSVTGPILATTVLVVVVYGSYLLVTYLASRGIVRASLGKKLLG